MLFEHIQQQLTLAHNMILQKTGKLVNYGSDVS